MPTLPDVLSAERFETYKNWAGGDDALGLRLYTFNVQLSAALYGPLHMLEVALRNVFDKVLSAAYGPNWLTDNSVLRDPYQQACVITARNTLVREGKAATHGQMVAELNFGFWTSLVGKKSNHLWGPTLRRSFQAPSLQRHSVAGDLRDIRLLRNRVAHYEPILAQPLAQRYASIVTLTGWLSPSGATWLAQNSDWGRVYPAVPILVPDATTGRLQVSPVVTAHLPI